MAISKWQMALAASATCTLFVAPFAEASTYVVQSGDSLYKIAKKHNITVADLKAWNKLSSDRLDVNQSLVVAKNDTPVLESDKVQVIPPTATGSKLKTYRVVKGDTLSKIATKQGTTVAKLKEWNNLTSDLIKIGQVLIVKKDATVESSSLNSSTSKAPTDSAQLSTVDAMIQNQLAKETAISKVPSALNQKKYKQVIDIAKSYIGVPYVFGGNTPSGFDCSGFIAYVYNAAGIKNTRQSSLNYFLNATTKVTNPVPGDLVFFKNTYIETISHMGIYLGNGEMIHAGSNGIEITKLSYNYWSERQVAFKRFNNVK